MSRFQIDPAHQELAEEFLTLKSQEDRLTDQNEVVLQIWEFWGLLTDRDLLAIQACYGSTGSA